MTNLTEFDRLKKIYPGIAAWGLMMNYQKYYILRQLQQAEKRDAPRNVIFISKDNIKLLGDAGDIIRKQLLEIAVDPDGVLKCDDN